MQRSLYSTTPCNSTTNSPAKFVKIKLLRCSMMPKARCALRMIAAPGPARDTWLGCECSELLHEQVATKWIIIRRFPFLRSKRYSAMALPPRPNTNLTYSSLYPAVAINASVALYHSTPGWLAGRVFLAWCILGLGVLGVPNVAPGADASYLYRLSQRNWKMLIASGQRNMIATVNKDRNQIRSHWIPRCSINNVANIHTSIRSTQRGYGWQISGAYLCNDDVKPK
ncbi:hypothetical protein OE88DRAFT_264841 [Heliocybe sulcata]|uniref:Uncharacterized protein n=1 Tax=Heliocybe sulcata TaxID=5364 RepID=A0A5C3N289_9AGAM|nr:hypothetical protein OE88DRAFT_264841 [Heliocybe sulcata]